MSLDDRPLLIGVSARIYHPGTPGIPIAGVWTKTLHYLEQSVAHWVLSGHAMAVMIPAVTFDSIVLRTDMRLSDFATALDGLVLQGGADVAPECYGETALHADWAGDAVRDRYEFELIDAFVDAGKPVFGICRGFQLLNVKYGGTLWQDIETQHPQPRPHRNTKTYESHFHEVDVLEGTRLAQLVGGAHRARVNSIHHQGVKTLADAFTVEALSVEDGLIEAFRGNGPNYLAAVQWHPEFHIPGDTHVFDDAPLLNDFLVACRAARRA